MYSCVPGEKRSALLAEMTRLREERGSESGEDTECVSQQPCRGTVGITNIQLPLKVEFVCSSHNRSGRTARNKENLLFYITFDILSERTELFMYHRRSAKSLLLRPDPLRALQHRRHPAGHGGRRSERRHHLLPHDCHSVSWFVINCASSTNLLYLHL